MQTVVTGQKLRERKGSGALSLPGCTPEGMPHVHDLRRLRPNRVMYALRDLLPARDASCEMLWRGSLSGM